MNAQLRRAAKACLFSTITGLMLTPDGFALADAPGRILHADAEETTVNEPSPLATLGEARPIPVRSEAAPSAPPKPTGPAKARIKAKPQPSAKRPVPGSASNPAKSSTAATAAPPVTTEDEEGIEQTGALQGRSYTGQRPRTPMTLPATAPQSSSMSPVERELEELYRKNGRQMPEMNMQEFQAPQPEAAPSQMPAGRASQQGNSAMGYQPGGRPTKPNFFERVFGLGRSRSKSPPRTSAPQSSRNSAPSAPSAYGPYVPGSTRPVPQNPQMQPMPPFRPTPAQVATPMAPPVAAPAQRLQPMPMREPTPLGPVGAPNSQDQQPVPRSINGLTVRDGQPLLDESKLRGDTESLELSEDDDETPPSRHTPQILPNRTANGPAESPYSGLKITPHESEDSIARAEELDKAFKDEPASVKPAPATSSSEGTATKPVPSAADSSLRHPLAGTTKTPPAAPAVRNAPGADDDELMELDDEEEADDDDDDKRSGKSDNAPADDSLSIPNDEKPVFPREATGGQAAAVPAAPGSEPTSDKNKEADKLAAAGAQKGFKGFCPVILKDERRLVEARSQFKSEHRGRTYTFSSIEAKQAFDENPSKYVPARDGKDVVRLAGGEEGVEGSLEHAAWYRGKLYLFSSADSRREFVEAPARFKVQE